MPNAPTSALSRNATPPSGEQFEIQRGALRAVITEVGAGLRSFTVDGHEWLDTYGPEEMASSGRGQVLLPWPNRIDHGRYTFGGTDYQLPINEVARHNAIHGLTRWLPWTPVHHEADQVTLALTLYPQPGYPFVLHLEERYALTDDGLMVRTTAHNVGAVPLPFGVGHHPYFAFGAALVDDVILSIPARSYFVTDERAIPLLPPRSVEGTSFDFREPHPIGQRVLDTGYTDLQHVDGWARVRLVGPGGSPSIMVILDNAHQFLQVYTGDDLPDPARRRQGIALEPYTCAANAFNNGYGVRTLPPGASFSSTWGILVERDGQSGR